jgi:hypothetical protein
VLLIYMCAGHRGVDMWWAAIVLLVFLQVLETPSCRGGATEILMCLGLDYNFIPSSANFDLSTLRLQLYALVLL